MSLELCILASGSAGNCSVIRDDGGRAMLVDAGIGPRTLATRLNGTGVEPDQIRAICLTHLDRDHLNLNNVAFWIRHGIRLYVHETRAEELRRAVPIATLQALIEPFEREFSPLDGVNVSAISLLHDDTGSHGFVFEGSDSRIGYATDLGRVPVRMFEMFQELDVLAIESNYDPQMQRESDRPSFLKQRIMGGRGHLSNEQAFEAVRKILDGAERRGDRLPGHIALLHRSQQCNCPRIVRRLFESDSRIRQRLTLSEQDNRTGWMGPDRQARVGEQLLLGWA